MPAALVEVPDGSLAFPAESEDPDESEEDPEESDDPALPLSAAVFLSDFFDDVRLSVL